MYNPNLPYGGMNWPPVGSMVQMTPTMTQNMIKVNGIESAKAYPMLPNSMAALFDSNEDIFYLKTTDSNNFPSIRVFKFVEVKEEIQNEPKYVTMDEFNKFKEEMLNGKQHIRKQWNGSKSGKQYTANSSNDGNSERFSEPKPDSSNAIVAEP